MRFPAKRTADFKIPPAGNHVAICNMVVDLGMQPGRGQYPDPKPKVYIRFELPNEPHTYQNKEGQEITGPMVIGREFTASMSTKSNLRPFIESWRGKSFEKDEEAAAFEFSKLPGQKCLLNVVHEERGDKVYANIKAATPLPKGMKDESKQHNKTVYFSLEDPTDPAFNGVPAWLQKKITERIREEKTDPAGQARHMEPSDDNDDSIPF